jgi:hypothetical protein
MPSCLFRLPAASSGAKDKPAKTPHLVAALAHGIGAVVGQVAVDAKSNEILPCGTR